ncbi:hypothetical protein GGI26_004851 [Coemansia sp. RSA 1358]|nr:hypothetical protein BX070DRAFT_235280 [Coemansia spiralis]KAJ1989829.1 hypothetical protein EDC05_004449 [Coemansia umbellata]KAJ2620619.1 hypothetical protein GGI26_004851 [Coemansia sp. RSA 1358]
MQCRALTYSKDSKSKDEKHIDPVEHRRNIRQTLGSRQRRSVASDISTAPTNIVRLSNLPLHTTPADIRYALASKSFASRINFLMFEYDYNLRPLNSCRVTLFNTQDASDFLIRTNRIIFAGNRVRADFVNKSTIPNKTRDKYVGNALGRLVFLYGYPPHMNQHQIRDYYRQYDLVDTTLPGVQPAPQQGQTFLCRRGAFILQFSTTLEAHRFVRDVQNSEYVYKDVGNKNDRVEGETSAFQAGNAAEDGTKQRKCIIRAILLH